MATGGGQPSAHRVTCAVCLERYRRPKLLPCFHTFCLTCLESLAPPPAPSLTCPKCRTVAPLPQGGAAQFQSNFYLEEELLSHVARKCDVCSESRDVEYRSVECQQDYCAPCRTTHDKITTSRHHTLIPFSLASAAKHDQREGTRRCPKHDFQRHIFFCKVCDVTICPHCKLTSHDGHVTEDLADAATKARQDLQAITGETQQRMRKLEILEADTKKMKEKLLAELNCADDVIKKRASDVIVWAQQAREEALGRARELCHVTEDCLNQTLEATQHTISSLTARTDHVTAVLSGQNHTEVIQLLANIMAAEPGCLTKETAAELANGLEPECPTRAVQLGDTKLDEGHGPPSYLLVNQNSQGNLHSTIISYVGHVSSSHSLSTVPAEVAVAAQSSASVSTKNPQLEERAELAGGDQEDTVTEEHAACCQKKGPNKSDRQDRAAELHSESPPVTAVSTRPQAVADPYVACFQRKPLPDQGTLPARYTCSSNSETTVTALCLTTDNKLWVKYQPPNTPVELLKFYDVKGSQLGVWYGSIPRGGTLFCVDDTLVSAQDWGWFKPTGEAGCLDNPPNDWALCSKSLPPHVVVLDKKATEYRISRVCVRSLHPLRVELVPVCGKGIKLSQQPVTFDVSQCGRMFCFGYETNVVVYCLSKNANSVSFTLFSSVKVTSSAKDEVLDATFLTLKGKELLVVVVRNYCYGNGDKCILSVYDHVDGFLKKLENQNEKTYSRFTAHTSGRMWRAHKGGEIVASDLTKETLK